ncbi:MAG TPA: Ig-like domain-containing protein, partial [Kofleriaceae bacterium]|nr:Ig-like domain-containing protein [Kofleriaceae bacterium]
MALVGLVACGDNQAGNGPPSVAGLEVTTAEDTAVTRQVQATDPDGDAVQLAVAGAQHGTVTLTGTSFTYTPEADYHGADSFTVTASDGVLQASATVTVTVTPVNDAPVGEADSFATPEDTALVVAQATLLANDTDVDGDSLTVTAVDNATHGTVAITGSDVTFTPDEDYEGPASFDYTVSDGTATATVAVTVTVGGVNDAPVAVDDTAATDEDVVLEIPLATLLANDADADGQTLSVTQVNNPTGGTVVIAGTVARFTPTANFNGAAGFDYTVSDGALTDVGHVAITVAPVNDPPAATDDTATTAEDTAVLIPIATLLANDSDVDGTTPTFDTVGTAVNGTATVVGTDVRFVPAADYHGPASFTYTITDGTLADSATVAVTVTPVNDAPVAVDDAATTAEDTALVIAIADLLANDGDVDGTVPTFDTVGAAVNGTATVVGTDVRFVPAADYHGPASFTYTITDGTLTDSAIVAVTVTPVNDAPVAVNDSATTLADTAVEIDVVANDTDVDGPTLTVASVQNLVGGTATFAGGIVTFTPDAGFSGDAGFDYTVTDGTATADASVTVTVLSTNVCGDGVRLGTEACDDDNTDDGDGCSATCTIEVPCGNGTLDA